MPPKPPAPPGPAKDSDEQQKKADEQLEDEREKQVMANRKKYTYFNNFPPKAPHPNPHGTQVDIELNQFQIKGWTNASIFQYDVSLASPLGTSYMLNLNRSITRASLVERLSAVRLGPSGSLKPCRIGARTMVGFGCGMATSLLGRLP
jgi:hypothetical protein